LIKRFFLSLFLFFLGVSVLAQKMSIDPILPMGFKDWHHKFEKSKKVNDKSNLVLNIYADRSLENLFWTWSVNDRIVMAHLVQGDIRLGSQEGQHEQQYWLGDSGGYMVYVTDYVIDANAAKDSIKFPTKEELEVIYNIFKGNFKDKFDFDFDEQAKEFNFELELIRFVEKIKVEEKPK